MAKTFSKEDVASHSKGANPWIIIDDDVYDLSTFQDEHPGKSSHVMRADENHMLTLFFFF